MSAVLAIEPPAGLPFNVEAEAALLGGMMCGNAIIDSIADMLTHEDFFEPLHGRIFAAIVNEHSVGRGVNPVTLRPMFEHDEAMKSVGGVGYLAQLTGSGVTVLCAKDFAWQVKDLARRRNLIFGLRGVIESLHGPQDSRLDLANAITEAENALTQAGENEDGERQLSGAECARLVIDGFDDPEPPGILSGIKALDDVLGSIQPTDLIIVGGRPGMAKSATAISYGLGAAARGDGVLFISLEMGRKQIGERELADLCFGSERRVPFSVITSGRVSTEQGRELARAYERLQVMPIEVVDIGSASVGKIGRLVRRYKRRFAAKGIPLKLVIVDYLQLVDANHKTSSPYERISEVSRGLKSVAKREDVGLMALCQLSRKVEERHDHRPQLSDLRDSGQIEQDADAVLFLLRPEYYLKKAEPQADDEEKYAKWQAACSNLAGVIEFICAKNRRGSEGLGRGMFYGAYQAVR